MSVPVLLVLLLVWSLMGSAAAFCGISWAFNRGRRGLAWTYAALGVLNTGFMLLWTWRLVR